MTFELPLTEERVKSHQVTALHLFISFILVITGAVVLAGYYGVSKMPIDKALQYRSVLYYGQAVGIGVLVLGLGLLLLILLKNKTLMRNPFFNFVLRVLEFMVMIALTILAIRSHVTVPAVTYGLLAATVCFAIYWERLSDKPLVIKVDQTGIRLPVNSRKRFIDWRDVDHVLLRFGTLTLNMHDNSMMQWSVGNLAFEKELFDVYCIRQIEKAKERRVKNDW